MLQGCKIGRKSNCVSCEIALSKSNCDCGKFQKFDYFSKINDHTVSYRIKLIYGPPSLFRTVSESPKHSLIRIGNGPKAGLYMFFSLKTLVDQTGSFLTNWSKET